MKIEPVVLQGRLVRLEPFTPEHVERLWPVIVDETNDDVWRFLPARPRSQSELAKFVGGAIQSQEANQALGFVVLDAKQDAIVGSTGYWNIAPEHLRLEIGYTWLKNDAQRSGINTEMKYLLVGHAIENIGCERVEFKTDDRNTRSKKALARIGATREGTLRNHMQNASGERRDSTYFSILRAEWPTVKTHLESLMSRYGK